MPLAVFLTRWYSSSALRCRRAAIKTARTVSRWRVDLSPWSDRYCDNWSIALFFMARVFADIENHFQCVVFIPCRAGSCQGFKDKKMPFQMIRNGQNVLGV